MNLKQNITLILSVFLLTALISVAHIDPASGQGITGKTFMVASGGSDNNPGTIAQPMATLEAARDASRKAGSGNNRIIIMAGEYYFNKPVDLDSRDNGLTIEADTSGKVVLYGGTQVTGWRRDGEKFWSADLPGVKEGTWDFRSVVVNGSMPERARMPESGTLKYLNKFDVPWLTSIGGGWARKPTQEELTTLLYDPKDIPATLDVKNAEVRVFHSWDESLVGVKSNDTQRNALIFSKPTAYPPGGFRSTDYIVYNTREGMTKPGQWYIDRTNGKLVYWPVAGEDMATVKVIAPKIERIIRIAGDQDKKAENITVRGLIFQGTAMPFKSAGMGAISFDGAVSIANAQNCVLENLEIYNAGGIGISASQLNKCRITDCQIYNIGGGGARIEGTDLLFARNHIHHVGIYSPSAIGLSVGGSRNHIYRNEIHDVPYSGMIVGKSDILVEENLIYRVMLELHDGGAIYTFGVKNCIFRGNVIRDIETIGEGTAAFGYYLDEGSTNCIVENNVAIGLSIPTHNHIALKSIIRNNVFISDKDMNMSFQSSSGMTFANNTLVTPGRIRITAPKAVTTWEGNKIYSNGRDKNNLPQAFTIDSVMPFVAKPSPKTRPIEVASSIKAPTIDGTLATDEWPGGYQRLDRLPSGWAYTGAPVMVKFFHDKKFLYIGAMLTMFDSNNISIGDKWEKDDGVEVSIQGFDKGNPATFVVRTYVNGTIQSITDAGATAPAAERFGKGVKYASKKMDSGKGWYGEWAIPLDVIGLKPKPDMVIPFNMCAYINEYDKWHCWEGTLGESWQVDKAGVLKLK